MPSLSLPLIASLCLLESAIVHSASVCGTKRVYDSGSISRHIPYANLPNSDLAYDFSLAFTISTSLKDGEHHISASMDTGSTGVAIGATLLNLSLEDVQNFQKGYEALSGGTFWQGFWLPAEVVNLTFPAAGVTAKVPVLAVTRSSKCHEVVDGACKGTESDSKDMPSVHYLGVGFGRWTAGNPQATPDKAPFTNIAFIDNNPIPSDSFHRGYIITKDGVDIGLTPSNVQNFQTTKLSLLPGSPSQNDWRGVDASIAVDDSHWNDGTALFDTGIHQSYLRLDEETTAGLHTHTILDSNVTRTVLTDNSTVRVRIGKGPDYIADYEVKVGDADNAVRPYRGEFRPGAATDPAFINTGRFFYRGYEAMLDAECGWFGLRKIGGAGGADDTAGHDEAGQDDAADGGDRDGAP